MLSRVWALMIPFRSSVLIGCMTNDQNTPGATRRHMRSDKLKSDGVEADTLKTLAKLIEEARKLLREMDSVLGQPRQPGE